MQPGGFSRWCFTTTGSLYLGLPIYAAVATRSRPGTIDAVWLSEAAQRLAVAWDPAPRGLAWVLTVVLAIWVGDSVALFAGMAFGKRKLAPMISPNKSQEGAVGGLLASMVVGAVSFQGFGLGDWKLGLIAGAVIGLTGQIGDLAESVLKRQAGVKDSGSLIPGHGGVLDRIDALLFAFPAGFLIGRWTRSVRRLVSSQGADGRVGVAVLGSTGSIGRQTLNVIDAASGPFSRGCPCGSRGV